MSRDPIWYRSDTDMIHRPTCRYGRSSRHWVFADGKTEEQIREAMDDAPWLRACAFCMPCPHSITMSISAGIGVWETRCYDCGAEVDGE